MRHFRWSPWLGCAVAVLLVPHGVSAELVDPTGDTFGSGPVQHDITTYDAVSAAGQTTFTVNFNDPIAPPSAVLPNSLVGFIDLDIDRNPTTGGDAPWGLPLMGGNSWINNFIEPNPGVPPIPSPYNDLIALGDEYFVDLHSEIFTPGFVKVIDTSTNAVFAEVPIAFTSSSFTLSVPLVGTDGPLAFGLLVGTFDEATDRAPNGPTPALSTTVAEPCGLLLAGTGLVGLAWFGRYRRRGA